MSTIGDGLPFGLRDDAAVLAALLEGRTDVDAAPGTRASWAGGFRRHVSDDADGPSQAGLDALYDRYHRWLFGLFMRTLRDQDNATVALGHALGSVAAARLTRPEQLRPAMARAAYESGLRVGEGRVRSTRVRRAPDATTQLLVGIMDAGGDGELRRLVWRAMETLSYRERLLFELEWHDRVDARDLVAVVGGRNAQAVLNRARDRIRATLTTAVAVWYGSERCMNLRRLVRHAGAAEGRPAALRGVIEEHLYGTRSEPPCEICLENQDKYALAVLGAALPVFGPPPSLREQAMEIAHEYRRGLRLVPIEHPAFAVAGSLGTAGSPAAVAGFAGTAGGSAAGAAGAAAGTGAAGTAAASAGGASAGGAASAAAASAGSAASAAGAGSSSAAGAAAGAAGGMAAGSGAPLSGGLAAALNSGYGAAGEAPTVASGMAGNVGGAPGMGAAAHSGSGAGGHAAGGPGASGSTNAVPGMGGNATPGSGAGGSADGVTISHAELPTSLNRLPVPPRRPGNVYSGSPWGAPEELPPSSAYLRQPAQQANVVPLHRKRIAAGAVAAAAALLFSFSAVMVAQNRATDNGSDVLAAATPSIAADGPSNAPSPIGDPPDSRTRDVEPEAESDGYQDNYQIDTNTGRNQPVPIPETSIPSMEPPSPSPSSTRPTRPAPPPPTTKPPTKSPSASPTPSESPSPDDDEEEPTISPTPDDDPTTTTPRTTPPRTTPPPASPSVPRTTSPATIVIPA